MPSLIDVAAPDSLQSEVTMFSMNKVIGNHFVGRADGKSGGPTIDDSSESEDSSSEGTPSD